MITNFEEITRDLTADEMVFIPLLENGFRNHGPENPIKGPEIVAAVNEYAQKHNIKLRMTDARLRKCCNYIRTNSRLPVIATSNGYFISYNPEHITKQVRSLQERAGAIMACAAGLQRFLS